MAGIALDNYGDFSNNISNGHGCRTNLKERPHIVALRGPGNDTTGYCYIQRGKSVAHLHARTRAAATHKVSITVSPRGVPHANVTVIVDGKQRLKVRLSQLSPARYHGATIKTVKRYRIGFATNTGRVTDNHEIWNIRATYAPTLKVTTSTTPRTFTHAHQLLHYRFTVTNIGGDAVSGIRHSSRRVSAQGAALPQDVARGQRPHDLHCESPCQHRAGQRQACDRQGVGQRHPRVGPA